MLECKNPKIVGKYDTIFQTWEVAGLGPALYGMRNAKDSWLKSDSEWQPNTSNGVIVGEADMKLAQNLISGGAAHRKFMRDIMVWVDITAPLYFWAELDTYKVGTVRNSCSTMHTLMKKVHDLPPEGKYQDEIKKLFAGMDDPDVAANTFESWKNMYNYYKKAKLEDPDSTIIRKLKMMLPENYLQRSMYMISYEGIMNVNLWRKTHRLGEWHTDWMHWVHTLPYAKELIFGGEKG